MQPTESIKVACPTCGARYHVRSQDVFRAERTSCRRCRSEIFFQPGPLLRNPVSEDVIVSWLTLLADRDDS